MTSFSYHPPEAKEVSANKSEMAVLNERLKKLQAEVQTGEESAKRVETLRDETLKSFNKDIADRQDKLESIELTLRERDHELKRRIGEAEAKEASAFETQELIENSMSELDKERSKVKLRVDELSKQLIQQTETLLKIEIIDEENKFLLDEIIKENELFAHLEKEAEKSTEEAVLARHDVDVKQATLEARIKVSEEVRASNLKASKDIKAATDNLVNVKTETDKAMKSLDNERQALLVKERDLKAREDAVALRDERLVEQKAHLDLWDRRLKQVDEAHKAKDSLNKLEAKDNAS